VARSRLVHPGHGAWSRLGLVAAPTTLACGGPEAHFGEDAIAAMSARMPQAWTQVLEELDHFGPMERPSEVAASIVAAIEVMAGPAV
jgi:hypothetical protein